MLTIKVIPKLFKIAAKLDLTPLAKKIKNIDDKNVNATELGVEIVAEIIPQLGNIADDIPDLVAIYKNISLDEALEVNAVEFINEIINDKDIMNFFSRALQKRVEHNT